MHFFNLLDKDITIFILGKFRFFGQILDFHIFQSNPNISVSKYLLLVNRISIDLDIKNSPTNRDGY